MVPEALFGVWRRHGTPGHHQTRRPLASVDRFRISSGVEQRRMPVKTEPAQERRLLRGETEFPLFH